MTISIIEMVQEMNRYCRFIRNHLVLNTSQEETKNLLISTHSCSITILIVHGFHHMDNNTEETDEWMTHTVLKGIVEETKDE